MAVEHESRIKVVADTGAAQDAIGRLSDASLGLAKAVDTSGDAVKRSAAVTADATAKTNAAREATARASKTLNEHTAIVAAFGKDSREAAESQARLKAAQEAAEKATREAERALKAAAEAVEETARNADEKAVHALRRMKSALESAGKSAESTASDLRTMEARIEQVSTKAKGMGAAMASFMGNMAATAVASLTGRLADVGVHALSTAANFERMKTALATTLGGTEAAAKAFEQLQGFAAATPYSLEEVTNGFLKLKARGLDGSDRALRAWGDTASAMGKSLDDMVEAVADATTGEFERLKEFGIRASSQGDKVALTFRGVTTTVAKEAKAIEAELMRLGEVNFAGGMEAQSRTLGGMWSTMKDGFDQFIVTVMDSGITQALKSIMGDFSGMGETGKLLAGILGTALGGAFTVLGGAVKVTTAAVELFATAVNWILSPVGSLKDAVVDLAHDAFAVSAEEALKAAEAQKKLDDQYWESAKGTGTLASDMQSLIDLSGQYALSIAQEGIAHLAAANAADRRLKAEADLWKKLEEQQAKAEEKAIFDQFQRDNEMGPALPPEMQKRKEKKGKRKAPDLSGQGLEAAKRYEMETRREREQAFAAEVAAYEAESAAREKRISGISREIEAMDARGVAEREQVDLVFYTVEIESEAARAREALIDQRIDKEIQLAKWQRANARTAEQRERAQTRLEEAEHAKRTRALEKAAASEAKTARQREHVFSTLATAHNALAEKMIDAAFAAAEGEKVAVGAMLQELLKGVAKKHALLALAEAALAVGAAASYRYAAAAQHGASAALHGVVAGLAGVGAYAVGKVVDIPQRGGTGTVGAERGGGGGSAGGGGRARGADDEDVQAQEVPITHEQLRRRDSGGAARGGAAVVFHGPVNIYGAGGKAEFVNDIRAAFDRQDRRGTRART